MTAIFRKSSWPAGYSCWVIGSRTLLGRDSEHGLVLLCKLREDAAASQHCMVLAPVGVRGGDAEVVAIIVGAEVATGLVLRGLATLASNQG